MSFLHGFTFLQVFRESANKNCDSFNCWVLSYWKIVHSVITFALFTARAILLFTVVYFFSKLCPLHNVDRFLYDIFFQPSACHYYLRANDFTWNENQLLDQFQHWRITLALLCSLFIADPLFWSKSKKMTYKAVDQNLLSL